MAPHQQGSSRMSRSNTPVQEGGDLTVPIAIALLFVFGLATLVVIKANGGLIAVSMEGLTATVNVNAPQ
jgi:hypothetical protein